MSSHSCTSSSHSPISILLADDHTLFSESFKELLEQTYQFEVVGTASTGEKAIKMAKQLRPNVVLMDINMPGTGGLEATRKLRAWCNDAKAQMKIIMLSVYQNAVFVNQAMLAGADYYIPKSFAMEDIIDAITNTVTMKAKKNHTTNDLVNEAIINSMAPEKKELFQNLSPKEFQIFFMILRGDRIECIASKLCVINKTINHYRYRIFNKLNVKSDVELIHLAAQHGLIDPPHEPILESYLEEKEKPPPQKVFSERLSE